MTDFLRNVFLYLFCFLLCLCSLFRIAVAEPLRVLPPGQLPCDERLSPLKTVDGYFPFIPCDTREEWEHRASRVRRRVLVAAGLWPMPDKTPIEAVIHGRVDRDRYTVEKVYFQSWPGLYVTGNLYRPRGRGGRLPAVLCPHGHWNEGRFYDAGREAALTQIVEGAERFESGGRYPMQARCAQLARMGCVVFHYDMIGYGDSQQLAHRAGVRPEMNDPQSWGFFSPQAEARLQAIFGLQTYDSVRSLDFLCGLPDVDPARIGVTGASGGGTQTMILCAVDPRPAVAFPAVMVSTAMQGGCPCENASHLRVGVGNVELAALFAPKPLGMTAADDWTKEITAKGLPELAQTYRLFDAEELVMAKPLLQFGHNYNFVSREVMYHWFNKHLRLGLEEPIIEEDFRPLSRAEMSVWDECHPSPPGGEEFERSLLRRITEANRRQIESLAPNDERSLQEYRRIVGGALETMIGFEPPAAGELEAVDVESLDVGPWRMTKFLLRRPARGVELPAVRLIPEQWNGQAVIWIARRGKQAIFDPSDQLRPEVKMLLENGFAVVAADLFGQGEFSADGEPIAKARINKFPRCPDGQTWGEYAGYTFGYNPSCFAWRVHDVLSLVAFARGEDGLAADDVAVVGLDGAGHWVAAARAIAGKDIERAAIDTAGFRFGRLTAIDDPDFLPGGAKYGDLPAIAALSAPWPFWLHGEEGKAVESIAAAYRAAAREKKPDRRSFGGAGRRRRRRSVADRIVARRAAIILHSNWGQCTDPCCNRGSGTRPRRRCAMRSCAPRGTSSPNLHLAVRPTIETARVRWASSSLWASSLEGWKTCWTG